MYCNLRQSRFPRRAPRQTITSTTNPAPPPGQAPPPNWSKSKATPAKTGILRRQHRPISGPAPDSSPQNDAQKQHPLTVRPIRFPAQLFFHIGISASAVAVSPASANTFSRNKRTVVPIRNRQHQQHRDHQNHPVVQTRRQYFHIASRLPVKKERSPYLNPNPPSQQSSTDTTSRAMAIRGQCPLIPRRASSPSHFPPTPLKAHNQ